MASLGASWRSLKARQRNGVGLEAAVDAADEVDVLNHAVDDVRFVEAEALLLVEVALDDALTHRLLHNGRRVEPVWCQRDGGTALVEEGALVGAVEFGSAHRGGYLRGESPPPSKLLAARGGRLPSAGVEKKSSFSLKLVEAPVRLGENHTGSDHPKP